MPRGLALPSLALHPRSPSQPELSWQPPATAGTISFWHTVLCRMCPFLICGTQGRLQSPFQWQLNLGEDIPYLSVDRP